MKVAHLCNLFLPGYHPEAGEIDMHPGRWVLNLALAQRAECGIDARLVVQVPGAAANYSTEVEGVPVDYLAAPCRLRAATLFAFDARRIARFVRSLQPDLVHGHGTEDAYGLAAQKTGVPYVITAQGLLFLINREVPPPFFDRQRAQQVTERYCLRRCRDVIAKSEYVAKALREEHPHLAIHRIPNTFDPRLLEIPPAEKEPELFAFVGRFSARKGVHLICDALEILKSKGRETRLEVFGNAAHGEAPYEVGQKKRLRAILGDRVVFHGMKPGLEVAESVSRARALVAPSLEEMFGNQIVEALLVGTHVIVTEGTAMAENVNRFGNGTIVPQQNARALAGAMETALDSDSAGKDAVTAKDRIVAEFGPERVSRDHLAVYEQILGRAGGVAIAV